MKVPKPCPEGKVRNPATGRCKKEQAVKPAKAAKDAKPAKPAEAAEAAKPAKAAKAAKPVTAAKANAWAKKVAGMFRHIEETDIIVDVRYPGNPGFIITINGASDIPSFISIAKTNSSGGERWSERKNTVVYHELEEVTNARAFVDALPTSVNATAVVTIQAKPSEYASYTKKRGDFGKRILRDIVGKLIRDVCGVPEAHITMTEVSNATESDSELLLKYIPIAWTA